MAKLRIKEPCLAVRGLLYIAGVTRSRKRSQQSDGKRRYEFTIDKDSDWRRSDRSRQRHQRSPKKQRHRSSKNPAAGPDRSTYPRSTYPRSTTHRRSLSSTTTATGPNRSTEPSTLRVGQYQGHGGDGGEDLLTGPASGSGVGPGDDPTRGSGSISCAGSRGPSNGRGFHGTHEESVYDGARANDGDRDHASDLSSLRVDLDLVNSPGKPPQLAVSQPTVSKLAVYELAGCQPAGSEPAVSQPPVSKLANSQSAVPWPVISHPRPASSSAPGLSLPSHTRQTQSEAKRKSDKTLRSTDIKLGMILQRKWDKCPECPQSGPCRNEQCQNHRHQPPPVIVTNIIRDPMTKKVLQIVGVSATSRPRKKTWANLSSRFCILRGCKSHLNDLPDPPKPDLFLQNGEQLDWHTYVKLKSSSTYRLDQLQHFGEKPLYLDADSVHTLINRISSVAL